MFLSKLEADGLSIMNCRGQAGRYSAVQQRIRDINPKVEFVPCSNHSLNLICLHAASVAASSVTFFGYFRTLLFNFFPYPDIVGKY